MTLVQRPNAWVLVDLDPATTLTYAPRVDPAPLTAAGQSCALIPIHVGSFPMPSVSFWAVPLGSPPPGKPVLEYVGPPPPPSVQLPQEPQGGSP